MPRNAEQLRTDALAIWQAAVDAVRADRLVAENVRVENDVLQIGDDELPLDKIRRIVVVGAGKAGAGMAAGLEVALGETVARDKQLTGWINVPADCVRPLRHITLHDARPAGVNEPTAAGVAGAKRILAIVESLGPDDLCLCLISGGGSALLPSPVAGVTLADKLAVTRHLGAAGANITQLNTVRKQLSRIKGGGLARACRAGRLYSLIISDVIGDPLDVIASGPTVADTSTPQAALDVLQQFGGREAGISAAVFEYLERVAPTFETTTPHQNPLPACRVTNLVIGNNAVAVDGAGTEAVRRGYSPAMIAARELEGPAEDVGRHLADMATKMRESPGPDCLITGGEPIVKLAPASERGLGGRIPDGRMGRCLDRRRLRAPAVPDGRADHLVDQGHRDPLDRRVRDSRRGPPARPPDGPVARVAAFPARATVRDLAAARRLALPRPGHGRPDRGQAS